MSDDKKDLSLEELIEIAKTPTKEKIKTQSFISEAHEFAIRYNIQPGEYKVKSQFIYEVYRKWKNYKNYQSKVKFFRDFGTMFDKTRDAYHTYYLLDPSPFDTADEAYEKIKDPISRVTTPPGQVNVAGKKKT